MALPLSGYRLSWLHRQRPDPIAVSTIALDTPGANAQPLLPNTKSLMHGEMPAIVPNAACVPRGALHGCSISGCLRRRADAERALLCGEKDVRCPRRGEAGANTAHRFTCFAPASPRNHDQAPVATKRRCFLDWNADHAGACVQHAHAAERLDRRDFDRQF